MSDVDGLVCRVHSTTMPQASPDAPVFVMVHGIGLSHRYFDRLQTELIQHGHTHVLDLPGFGGTPKPEQQLDVEDYAAVIGEALDAEGIRSCVLIGHSMGAQFVTEVALQRPDLVSKLVLIGPVTDSARRSVIWHTLALGLDSLRERPLTNAIVFTDYARCGLPWYFTELPVMLKYRIHERLPQATQPVLIIRGSKDPVARHPWCSRLADIARDGRLVEVPGQPHVAQRGGAREVTEAILSVLRKDNRLPSQPGNSPVAARQEPRTIFGRLRTVVSGRNSATPRPDTSDFRSITISDRQCRAYRMMHTGAHESDVSPGEATGLRVFVLIHGIGMSHRYFTRLASVLADYGDAYLIDLPGYGWTGTPAEKMSNPASADLIGALLDEIGVNSCTVVGHSMGVQSATELAITRADLVSNLVLIGAAVDAKRRTAFQQALRLGVNSTLEKPLLNTVQFLDVLRCGPRWYFAELAVALAYRLEERLPLVKQRVLIMRGTRDLIAGTHWSRTLAETSQHGELLEVPGKPHAVHHSDPATVAAGILEFIEKNSPEPQAPHDAKVRGLTGGVTASHR
ncbi:pimeloyl-ACP methyl ester carboxylesterase [Arthrobacter sp. CAN_A6]|uniref:alpha/beta fold hydrolase n=1 Tax=Arthrobacter sp. CAN_A6 TaxID=2787721 RepID=UPI0018C9026B